MTEMPKNCHHENLDAKVEWISEVVVGNEETCRVGHVLFVCMDCGQKMQAKEHAHFGIRIMPQDDTHPDMPGLPFRLWTTVN